MCIPVKMFVVYSNYTEKSGSRLCILKSLKLSKYDYYIMTSML